MDALQPYLQPIVAAGANPTGINDVLRADVALVLAGDMLVKADMMSMANGLEVRSPFMDYRVVEFLLQLPSDEKIRGKQRKRIIQDAFRSVLPAELYHRPKQGFEVPMANWLRTALRRTIETEVLDRDRTEAEGYFHHAELLRLWQAVLSGRSGKEDLTLWAVLVFLRCVRR
jgi:asparagine synthase (glutamine-hydrolysing)